MKPLDAAGRALFEEVLNVWLGVFPNYTCSKDMLEHLHAQFCFMHERWGNIRASLSDEINRNINLVNTADKIIEMQLIVEKESTGIVPACRAGCSHCCKSERIVANPVEIRSILFHILDKPDLERELLICQILESFPTDSVNRTDLGSPCAMLVNDRCSIYEVRPMSCRGYFSASEKECESRLRREDFIVSGLALARFVEYAVEALRKSHSQMMEYEINTIFRMLFSDLSLGEQWASGNMQLNGEQFVDYVNESQFYRTL